MTDAYPPIPDPDDEWELRFTDQALRDLGVTGVEPNDIPGVKRASSADNLIDKYVEHYTETREPTGAGYVGKVGGGIHKLKSHSGQRGCVLVHDELHVVWLLGYTAEHDYSLFEDRHDTGALLPSEADIARVLQYRREQRFSERVGPGVKALIAMAAEMPGLPRRGLVGEALQLEVAVVVVQLDNAALADVYLTVRMPPEPTSQQTPDWPGSQLLPALAETSEVPAETMDYPREVPDGEDGMRAVDYAVERSIRLRDVDPSRIPTR